MDNYKKTIGAFGEKLAQDFLTKRGYKILASNFRLKKLELDIITKFGDKFVFIEVKTRNSASVGPAQDALKLSQIKDLKRAISMYCFAKKISPNNCQLDFIAVDLFKQRGLVKIKHFKDIF